MTFSNAIQLKMIKISAVSMTREVIKLDFLETNLIWLDIPFLQILTVFGTRI